MNRSEENIFIISHNLMLRQLLQDNNTTEKLEIKNGEIKIMEYEC